MNDLFNILDADAQQRETKRACIVAVARAKKQCGKFFAQAASDDDFMARLSLVTDKLNDIVREACIEENTADLDTVHHVLASELANVYGEIMRSDIKDENIDPTDEDAPDNMVEHELDNRKLFGKPEDFKGASAMRDASTKHAWDDYAERESNPDPGAPDDSALMAIMAEIGSLSPEEQDELRAMLDALPGDQMDYGDPTAVATYGEDTNDMFPNGGYESSVKTAVETGDTYTQETVDLPKADDQGLSQDPSPKMDKGNAGDENHTSQKPIDIPSVQTNPQTQDVSEPADYTATLESPGVVKSINADTPLQPEHHVAPNTDTFPNKDQANPVTSKWKIIG